ncbi:hypothetical protein D3C75_1268500 [compost metagenome]
MEEGETFVCAYMHRRAAVYSNIMCELSHLVLFGCGSRSFIWLPVNSRITRLELRLEIEAGFYVLDWTKDRAAM